MDTLSYKTVSLNAATIEKEWWVVDAEDLVLGRLATEIAMKLRGKHKAGYTPHVDCGDNVIVLNAGKVRLTGKKWNQKIYQHYTGYPGGQRDKTAKEVRAKHPIRLVEGAVRGMLPKSKLGKAIFKNMHVYEGTEHPHAGQQPKELKF